MPNFLRSKLSQYRISDNYVRFYLKVIDPNRVRIESGAMKRLPRGWAQVMGLQFENLVLKNRLEVARHLQIPSEEIVAIGPYFQAAAGDRKGCQIDLLIQTKFNTLYVCEVKYSRTSLGADLVFEMEERIARLKRPRGFSIRPVLIHLSGVSDELLDREYFAHLIDFECFLQST